VQVRTLMAVTRDTLRLLDGMRISMLAPVDDAALRLVRAWAIAWNEISAEWDAALSDLVASSKAGKWPSRSQISRATRAKAALAATREALHDLTRQLPIVVTQSLPTMTSYAVAWSNRITASQYPLAAGSPSGIMAGFDRADPAALAQIVRRTTQQVTALSLPLSAQAEQAMSAVLIRGVATGQNPRRVASLMLSKLQGAFNGGRNRALVIARTEMLDAHRAAAHVQDLANKDIVTGWQWLASLDRRTCPACLAMHGSKHPVTEPGPMGHQQCRCTRVPVTKSWRELGFALDEPGDVFPDARAWFDVQPQELRVAVMGRKRLDLLDSGRIGWGDLVTRRSTDGWRDSFAPTPVKDLTRRRRAA
jgi:SPP1 gp7 family putative phage head morphogenesis protein